jgi:lysophospholipase L1-like esterase
MKHTSSHLGRWLHTTWDMLGITVILIIAVELTSLGLLRLFDEDPRQRDFRLDSDAYAEAPWAVGYFEEDAQLRARWNPYTYWRMQPFNGRYIHVDEHGRRRTVQPGSEARGPKVFMFGGSTMWGTGARDSHTIPSQLAGALNERGISADIVNLGEIGYVSTQEVITLMMELRAGNVPDVVVFYDGINDVTSAIHSGVAGIPHNEYRRRAEFNLLSRHRSGDYDRTFLSRWINQSATVRVARAILYRLSPDDEETARTRVEKATAGLAGEVAHMYRKNIDMVRLLAKQHGFDTLFYLQPVIFRKETLTSYEQVQLDAASVYHEFFDACYAAVTEQVSAVQGFRDISSVLAKLQAPCFLDFMHIGEDANGLIAGEMAHDIAPLLSSRLSPSADGGHN